MGIALVQENTFDNAFAGGSSATCAFGSTLTPGSKLFAMASLAANQTVTFSDSAGNIWSTVVRKFNAGIPEEIAIGWADNTNGATSGLVVTTAYGGSSVNRAGGIAEFTGLATGGPDTSTAGNTGTGTTSSDLSMTTTVAGDLILTAAVGEGVPFTAGSGFTLIDQTAFSGAGWEWQVQPSAGLITPTIVQGSTGGFAIVSAAFKPDAGGGGGAASLLVPPIRRLQPLLAQ